MSDVIVVESGVKPIRLNPFHNVPGESIRIEEHSNLVVVEGTQTHKMRVGDRLLIHPAFYIVLKKGANHAICQFEFRAIGLNKSPAYGGTIEADQIRNYSISTNKISWGAIS